MVPDFLGDSQTRMAIEFACSVSIIFQCSRTLGADRQQGSLETPTRLVRKYWTHLIWNVVLILIDLT